MSAIHQLVDIWAVRDSTAANVHSRVCVDVFISLGGGNRKRDCSDGALRNLVFIWYVSEVHGYLLGSRVTGIDCASERSSGQYRAWGQRDRRRGDWLGNRCFSVYLVADTAIFVTLQGTGLGHKVM